MENRILIDRMSLRQFLEQLKHSGKSIGTYINRLDIFDFEKKLDELKKGKNCFFYWKSSTTTLLAVDQLISRKSNLPTFLILNQWHKEIDVFWGGCHKEIELENVPFIVGANSFSKELDSVWHGFNPCEWFIPRLLFFQMNTEIYLLVNFNTSANDTDNIITEKLLSMFEDNENFHSIVNYEIQITKDENSESEWNNIIKILLKEINSLKIKKIVYARKTLVEVICMNDMNISFTQMIKNINKNKSNSVFTYCFANANGGVFLGATPELLLRTKKNHLYTESLAATAKTSNEIELQSEKNLLEHEIVSVFIKQILLEFCSELNFSTHPNIRRLNGISHLITTFYGKLKGAVNPVVIAEMLQPTPAVCGDPREEAYSLIDKYENFSRGLYSGSIGWTSYCGKTVEISVAIRSVLMFEKNKFHIYTGCGLVSNSTPEEEYNEVDLKLISILKLVFDYGNESFTKS